MRRLRGWFGIEVLGNHYGPLKAVVIQAVAFGVRHGVTPHAFFTAVIGFAYGLIYLRRRKLLTLMLSHT